MNKIFLEPFICNQAFCSTYELKRSIINRLDATLGVSDFFITEHGRIVGENEEISIGKIYRIHPRILGGKGGFGSMLRALGAQIEKTTNREACRDLSGRRMRDVNNEKKLKKWIDDAPEREKVKKEKEENKKKTTETKHYFDSTVYDQQMEKIQSDFDDAIKHALKSPLKRKAEKQAAATSKTKDWFGFDMDGSDSDDDDDDHVTCKKPKLELNKENSSSDSEPGSEDKTKETENSARDGGVCRDTNPELEDRIESCGGELTEDKESSTVSH